MINNPATILLFLLKLCGFEIIVMPPGHVQLVQVTNYCNKQPRGYDLSFLQNQHSFFLSPGLGYSGTENEYIFEADRVSALRGTV